VHANGARKFGDMEFVQVVSELLQSLEEILASLGKSQENEEAVVRQDGVDRVEAETTPVQAEAEMAVRDISYRRNVVDLLPASCGTKTSGFEGSRPQKTNVFAADAPCRSEQRLVHAPQLEVNEDCGFDVLGPLRVVHRA